MTEEVLTIADVAKRAGWTRQRMHRYLSRVNIELHGLLLINIGNRGRKPTYRIALSSLRKLNLGWFDTSEDVPKRVTRLEAQVDRLEKVVSLQDRALRAIRGRRVA